MPWHAAKHTGMCPGTLPASQYGTTFGPACISVIEREETFRAAERTISDPKGSTSRGPSVLQGASNDASDSDRRVTYLTWQQKPVI